MIIPVTQLEYDKGRQVFDTVEGHTFVPVSDNETALASFIESNGCSAVVVGVAPYSGPLYNALPQGGLILRFGVGTDNIDLARAAARGIRVANTPGALDQSVAEHTLFLIGALVRHVGQGDLALKQGTWAPVTGDELGDLKLGIVGMGRIGARVARMAHATFGMEILVCETLSEEAVATRLEMDAQALRQQLGYTGWSSDPDFILGQADVVSAHLPVVAATRGFFCAARFAALKRGSLFVNTARGALVVESDLVAALKSGHLGGAALDVYEREPYTATDAVLDLRTVPTVIMTPHIASNTRAANRRMASMVIENLLNWEAGLQDAVHIVG